MSDKKAVWDISYGVYIITSIDGEKKNGQIATTVMQVTCAPPQIVVCLSKETLTHEYVTKSKKFGVSILEQDIPMLAIGQWGFKTGRDIDKFQNVKFKIGEVTGVPFVLDYTLSAMETNVVKTLDVGTHTLFVGEIVGSEVFKDGIKLTYEYYQKEKKGKSPKTAPTYHG